MGVFDSAATAYTNIPITSPADNHASGQVYASLNRVTITHALAQECWFTVNRFRMGCMRTRMLVSVVIGILVIVGCGPSQTQTLPTVASMPTTAPQATTAGDGNTTQPTDAANTDTEPTPTREGDAGAPPTPDLLAGSGFGLGQITTLTPFPLGGAGFAAEIIGSEEQRITGDGAIRCDAAGNYIISSASDENTFPRIQFSVPPATPPGAYPLVDVSSQSLSIRPILFIRSGVTYDFQMNGTFALDALPDEDGGQAKGAFEYGVSAISDPTQTVLVRGGFDFEVPAGFCK
jgi:hypothetical protein